MTRVRTRSFMLELEYLIQRARTEVVEQEKTSV